MPRYPFWTLSIIIGFGSNGLANQLVIVLIFPSDVLIVSPLKSASNVHSSVLDIIYRDE